MKTFSYLSVATFIVAGSYLFWQLVSLQGLTGGSPAALSTPSAHEQYPWFETCGMEDTSMLQYKVCLGEYYDDLIPEIESQYKAIVQIAEEQEQPWLLTHLSPFHSKWQELNEERCFVHELHAAQGNGYGLEVLTCKLEGAKEYLEALKKARQSPRLSDS